MRAEHTETVNCPSCGATLVAGLRFCRMCGYRLGEGVEEYVPTQRFDPSQIPTAAQQPPPATDPFAARQTWGAAPIQPARPFGTPAAFGQAQPEGATSRLARICAPRRGGWWMWVVIALVLLFAGGVLPLAVKVRNRGRAAAVAAAPANSLLAEADDYDTADGGGAMIAGLAGPGTSLEAAGLIGGDTIIQFDGKPVRDEDALRKLIAATPPGKQVEVVFIRDGETRRTVLTTVPREAFRGTEALDSRPGGRGLIGVDPGKRVRLPNSNAFGVELRDVNRNGPADLSGLKEGDVVFEFNGKPVRTAGDLRLRIYEAVPGETVPVSVMRDGQRVDVPVKIGRQRD